MFDCSSSSNSTNLKRQLTIILKYPSASLFVSVEVQRPNGTSDCGLFAIAFAHTLCLGLDPHTINFKQNLMRAHYESCIDDKKFTMFSTSLCHHRQAARKRIKCETKLRIFCKCPLPWDKDDAVRGTMVVFQM